MYRNGEEGVSQVDDGEELGLGCISFSRVLGSGTHGALGITALLTACKSCTILHVLEGAAFHTGNMGVLHGDSSQGIRAPFSLKASNIGLIPLIASFRRGYCLW